MSTHPINQYLKRERLIDLAQFAVPDGHDLWPEIERAARRSAAARTTLRPGILSLGFTRAWTAVGILLIAATFAVLGFALAVLTLSNGQRSDDQRLAPASQPDATATPMVPVPTVPATTVPTVAATLPSTIRDRERTALAVLYDATGGEDWKTSDGWLSNGPLNQWQRVATDESGKVIDLDLAANQLNGEIPTELGNLSNLKLLYISDNNLTGALPQSLTGISGLESFHFHNNPGLCAPIDEAFQTWLQGIDEVRGSSCAPEDSAEDREVLVGLYDGLDGENWTNSTNWLTERPVREWHGVTSDASGRVDGLLLEWNGMTGELPKELGTLTSLKRLELGNNNLTGEIPKELGNLSNLETLLLHSNRLDGEIPTELVHLSNLEALVLSSNQLTGEIPDTLSSLTNLRVLTLDVNQLTGEIPNVLGNLTKLELLALSANRLSGEIPTELGNLSNLVTLLLGFNWLTGEIPEELGNLSNLGKLTLYDNQFSGCIPVKLRDVPQNDLRFPDMPPFC